MISLRMDAGDSAVAPTKLVRVLGFPWGKLARERLMRD